jgi:hypothetical protein
MPTTATLKRTRNRHADAPLARWRDSEPVITPKLSDVPFSGCLATPILDWQRGHLITSPPPDVCALFSCIQNFDNGKGYLEQCNDGMVSMSGGRPGACSRHSGENQPIYQG